MTLVFVGTERAHLSLDGVIKPLDFHRDCKEICRLVNVAVEFPTNQLSKGQYSYPFMLYLPEWLPDSLELESGGERFVVEYCLRAQLVPATASDLVTDLRLPKRFDQISKYRGSRTLKVF